jgi:hypothetical protein
MQTVKNNMAQVAKTQKPKKKRKMIMSPAAFKQLKQAHQKLYTALFRRELLAGKTIGAASHSAFEFIKAKIKTMDRGPVRRVLNFINVISSRRTKKRIMPSKNRDAMVAFMPEKRQLFASKIPHDISSALGVINMLSAQHKPKQKTITKPTQPVVEPTVKPIAKPMTKPIAQPIPASAAKPTVKPVAEQTELATIKQKKHILVEFMSVVADARTFAAIYHRQHNR